MNLPYARLTRHRCSDYLQTCKQKLWLIVWPCGAHSRCTAFSISTKHPGQKFPIWKHSSSLHCSSCCPPQVIYFSLIQLRKTRLQVRTPFPHFGMLKCWMRNMFRKWFYHLTFLAKSPSLKVKTNRIRRISMPCVYVCACVPILLPESHDWFSKNCVWTQFLGSDTVITLLTFLLSIATMWHTHECAWQNQHYSNILYGHDLTYANIT